MATKEKRSLSDIVWDEVGKLASIYTDNGARLMMEGRDDGYSRAFADVATGHALRRHEVRLSICQAIEKAAKEEGYRVR